MTRAGGRLRWGLRIVAGVVLGYGALAVRVVYSARTELAAAEVAAESGEADLALAHYRRAARYYAPGSPYHVRALDRLAEIARTAEAAGDLARALSAQRAIRGSIMAARSFYVPEAERLRTADGHIARLMAEQEHPSLPAGKSKSQRYAEHLALLETSPDPNLFWTLVLLVGFAGFTCATFVFSARAIDENDRLIRAEALRWGAVIAAAFGLFALGLSLA